MQTPGTHKLHSILTFLLGAVSIALASTSAVARPHQCTIIYALDGVAHESFNQQVESLEHHLKEKKVELIDINDWQSSPPHVPVTGREKALLRKRYALSFSDDNAVLLNARGKLVERYSNTVDLVDILMNCPYVRNTPTQLEARVAAHKLQKRP